MILRITLQPAYILHRRPFRETSLLLQVLTADYGRIALVARGVRTERSKLRAVLQPFSPLVLSFQGRGDLMTLQSAESNGLPLFLQGERLASGFYLNELLVRFLPESDASPTLFAAYSRTLTAIAASSASNSLELTLRLFEKQLLEELGYGLLFIQSIPDAQPFFAERFYRFYPGQGFVLSSADEMARCDTVFSGKSLLALASGALPDENSLRDAKRLLRMALAALPGARPLQSRRLFVKTRKTEEVMT